MALTIHGWQFDFHCLPPPPTLTKPSNLLLVPNGSNVSQDAVHLILRHALADVVLDEPAERGPDGVNVILTQITFLRAILPKVQSR